ncbi:potassium voltage-gated channel subfamily A member 1-like [Stylophora pistillata]|uniref:potassium voltage-gated channel subfamily A member 1-like n=1 Tax=Stylophora pistillata TaxID=50429 RepID=UPI000C04AE22|nr:potassium voltage-gated channel subfamily A member 1-like [Stylophora pistillata]
MLSYINKLSTTSDTAEMKSALRATNDFRVGPKLYSKNYNQRASFPPEALSSLGDSASEDRRLYDTRVKINISGKVYETLYSTLAKFPNTLLGNPSKREQYFDQTRQEYFFNRNRNAFDAILFYYQSNGLLTRPNNVRLQEFCDELNFFQIEEEIVNEFKRDECGIEDEDDEEVVLPSNAILAKLWLWLEYPKYSKVAKLFAVFSVTFIAIYIYVLCAEKIDGDRTDTNSTESSGYQGKHLTSMHDILESVCISWFTLEFILRLISCPNKLRFILNILNIIDLASILPYYFELSLGEFEGDNFINATRLLIRVSRLSKLARHLDELTVLAKTVRSTWRELVMILFFILITTAIFSGWTFYVEYEEQKSFSSIPATAWFVIISMTNVGYGDMVPVTLMGKLLGAICAIAGLLVIALPSPIIFTKFRLYYEKEKRKKLPSYKL